MTLLPGARFGPYEILSPIYGAGLEEVYRGRDHENRCDVAIRVLWLNAAVAPTVLPRLESSVLAASVLTHPNILTIYDVGAGPTTLYIVSEPFEGATLRQALSRGAVSVRAAVWYAAQIARALVAAHRKGIAHGDVRSDNILLTPKGGIILFGFGLSSVTRADSAWDLFTFAAVCRELITGVPTSGAMPSRRFLLALAAVVGLLAFVGTSGCDT